MTLHLDVDKWPEVAHEFTLPANAQWRSNGQEWAIYVEKDEKACWSAYYQKPSEKEAALMLRTMAMEFRRTFGA